MKNAIFLIIILLCSFGATLAKSKYNDGSINLNIQRFVDSIKKQGVHQYLLYKMICSGECESKPDCKCNNNSIIKAIIFYQVGKKNYSQTLACCTNYHSTVIADSFFTRIFVLSNNLKKVDKNKFLPPIATDQITYNFLYYNYGIKFTFSLSEAQITNGTEEQKSWNSFVNFKLQKKISDFVQQYIK